MSSIISASETVLDRERFDALWGRCSTSDGTASTTNVWDNLVKRYTEKHRHYHNPRHMICCLQQLDSSASLIEDKNAIEMAIWFHDLVFEPMASDNEERSADLFKILANGHFSSNFVDTVSDIIVATKHCDAPSSSNKAYMLDIDLSSLGTPWMYFRQDCIDLRAEQTGISDIRFYSGKLKFLNTLIRRPRIYFTDSFFNRYELEARRNIMRYTSTLETQGYC